MTFTLCFFAGHNNHLNVRFFEISQYSKCSKNLGNRNEGQQFFRGLSSIPKESLSTMQVSNLILNFYLRLDNQKHNHFLAI